MEYQKIINLLDNAPNQPSKYITKNWVEINDDSRGMCSTYSQIKFKILMLKSSLCDYNDACIPVKETIKIPKTGRTATPNNRNEKVILKNCAPFTDRISEIIHK